MPNEFHLSPNELFIYLFGIIHTHLDLLLRPSVGSVLCGAYNHFSAKYLRQCLLNRPSRAQAVNRSRG